MSARYLVCPMRVQSRELDSRLVLAAFAAREGIASLIGHHRLVKQMGPHLGAGGVAMGPDFSRSPLRPERVALRAAGFRLVFLDNSGGVFPGDDGELDFELVKMVRSWRVRGSDRIAVWGERQRASIARTNPACTSQLVVTGHPRFELSKPRYHEYFAAEAKALRARYGPFVLVNTNWADHNPYRRLQGLIGDHKQRRDPSRQPRMLRDYVYAGHALARFVELIHRLRSEHPELTVVVRPHLREDVSLYESVFLDIEGVRVVREGSVQPWLLATEALLHDGCTTAMEAHLAGVAVLNYTPDPSAPGAKRLPNSFGVTCRTEDEVVRALARARAGQHPAPAITDEAKRHLRNLDGDGMRSMLELLLSRMPPPARRSGQRVPLRVRAMARAFDVARRHGPRTREADDDLLRFPPLDPDNLRERGRRAGRLAGIELDVTPLGTGAVLVRAR